LKKTNKQTIFLFRALYFNLIGLIFILSLCCGVRLVVFAKYYSCDPLRIGLFKQTDQVKREKCIQFMKFLTAKENQNELLNFGYFPVRKSGARLYENDKEMYQKLVEYGRLRVNSFSWEWTAKNLVQIYSSL